MTEVFLQASKLPVFFFSAAAKMKSRFTGLHTLSLIHIFTDRIQSITGIDVSIGFIGTAQNLYTTVKQCPSTGDTVIHQD